MHYSSLCISYYSYSILYSFGNLAKKMTELSPVVNIMRIGAFICPSTDSDIDQVKTYAT